MKRIYELIIPYWRSPDSFRSKLLLGVILSFLLGILWLNFRLNEWNLNFYNSLEKRDHGAFVEQLWVFTFLAFSLIFLSTFKTYLTQKLEMTWREWETKRYIEAYVTVKSIYTPETPNIDQRIADDIQTVVNYTLNLTLGLISAILGLLTFINILWGLSGPLIVGGIEIPGYMVFVAIGYSLVGSWIILAVGRKMVPLEAQRQALEANFRAELIEAKNQRHEHMFSTPKELISSLINTFKAIVIQWKQVIGINKRLNIASICYSQAAVIFPLLVASPKYFLGAITLGGLMQISSAFGRVQDSLSWFIDSFKILTDWKASVNRLLILKEELWDMNRMLFRFRK